jgi:hypothetical protein
MNKRIFRFLTLAGWAGVTIWLLSHLTTFPFDRTNVNAAIGFLLAYALLGGCLLEPGLILLNYQSEVWKYYAEGHEEELASPRLSLRRKINIGADLLVLVCLTIGMLSIANYQATAGPTYDPALWTARAFAIHTFRLTIMLFWDPRKAK